MKAIQIFFLLVFILSCKNMKAEDPVPQAENKIAIDDVDEDNENYEWFYEIAKIAAMENEEFDEKFKDVSLVPYIESGNWGGGRAWRELGYINCRNFEIMIPAQYWYAGPFLYGYAVVRNNEVPKSLFYSYRADPYEYKYRIINKKGTEILTGFDGITLLDTENGDFVFALTEKYLKKGERLLSFNYQLFNLSTGNVLIKEDIRDYDYVNYSFPTPKIMFFSNYMTYDDDIYEIKDNGTLEKTEADIDSLVSKIMEERNLNFEYLDMLDFNVLLQNIPDTMSIVEVEKKDNQLKDEKPVYFIRPINRDKIHPLKKNKLLYNVWLANRGNNETYIGLYDAEENKWTIPPITLGNNKGDPEYIGFSAIRRSGYEDWIIYTYFIYFSSDEYADNSKSYYNETFYNIRERKIYLFRPDDGFDDFMVYWGYHENQAGKWDTKDY